MNNIVSLIATCVLAIVANSTSLAAEPNWVKVPRAQYAEICELISLQQRANQERIHYWSGKYRYNAIKNVDWKTFGKGVKFDQAMDERQTSSGVIEFNIDFAKNSIHTRYKPDKQRRRVGTDSKGNLVMYGATARYTIQTPKESLTIQPDEAFGRRQGDPDVSDWNAGESKIVHRDASEAMDTFKIWGDVFDPRYLFGDQGTPFYELFKSRAEDLRSSRSGSLAIEIARHEGNILYQIITHPRNDRLNMSFIRRVTVESSCGFNVTDVHKVAMPSNRLFYKAHWTYKNVDGVYLPEQYHVKQYHYGTEKLNVERSFELLEFELNKEINPDVFTVKQFEVDDGDRLVDRVENKLLVRNNDQWITPDEFVKSSNAMLAKRKWSTLFVVNVAMVVCLVLFYTVKKLNQTSKAKD